MLTCSASVVNFRIVSIKFYANDSLGNIGTAEVSLERDIEAPSIIINSPSEGEEFGNNAPGRCIIYVNRSLGTITYGLSKISETEIITSTMPRAFSDSAVFFP